MMLPILKILGDFLKAFLRPVADKGHGPLTAGLGVASLVAVGMGLWNHDPQGLVVGAVAVVMTVLFGSMKRGT